MARAERIRATATPGTPVGQTRYRLYRKAYARVKDAQETGFYLEAITIIESLVSDRLESRLCHLGVNVAFKPLGKLIDGFKSKSSKESDLELRRLVAEDLDGWRGERNRALHEMAKLVEGEDADWDTRYDGLRAVATRGAALLRKIDKRCGLLRRQKR